MRKIYQNKENSETVIIICNFRLCMVNYIILYKKFVEHHVIKLILLKISKLSARLTQAIIRDKLQRLKHTQDICTRQLITMFKCARALDKSNLYCC